MHNCLHQLALFGIGMLRGTLRKHWSWSQGIRDYRCLMGIHDLPSFFLKLYKSHLILLSVIYYVF